MGERGYCHNFLNSRQVWSSFHAPSSYGANHTTVSCQAAPRANYLNSIVHKMILDRMSTAGLEVLPPVCHKITPRATPGGGGGSGGKEGIRRFLITEFILSLAFPHTRDSPTAVRGLKMSNSRKHFTGSVRPLGRAPYPLPKSSGLVLFIFF